MDGMTAWASFALCHELAKIAVELLERTGETGHSTAAVVPQIRTIEMLRYRTAICM